MNAIAKLTPAPEAEAAAPTGLALLRVPFPAHQISKLPKGGTMLDYVGHASATNRLLDADPHWNWEPLAMSPEGFPALDRDGGLWIRLTICGITRLGYGSAPGKKGGDAMKELIGDAIRNGAMRFGVALDLWHKGDLHAEEGETKDDDKPVPVTERGIYIACQAAIDLCDTEAKLTGWANDNRASMAKIEADDPEVRDAVLAYWKGRLKAVRAAPKPKPVETFDVENGDSIPF